MIITGFKKRLECLLEIGLLRVTVSLIIEEVILANMVRLRLLASIRIHFVVNISWVVMLQTQDLRVNQEKEPCIRFTQENSIENSVQDSLPYILNSHSPC